MDRLVRVFWLKGLLCVHFSFTIISMGKRELFVLLCSSSLYLMIAVWLFLTMPYNATSLFAACDRGIS